MSTQSSILLKNARVWTPDGFISKDLLIKDGLVDRIADKIAEDKVNKVYDLSGCEILPSFVDMHVHLREPGYSQKETIETGTEAAAAGGFTCVCPMPNLNPAPDSLENLRAQLDIIDKEARIDVLPFATITKGRSGMELADFESLAPYVAGFSDDGTGVQSEVVMHRAMEKIAPTGKILAAHCEVESLLDGGYIHKGEYAAKNNHKGISSESEWKEVERDIELAEKTGCRLHICHVSTKESVELIRKAKAKGVKVTAETGPHYLTFTDADLEENGRFKMNPPIRGTEDREALRKGIIDGTIDVIATDHAPHTSEEKAKGLAGSAMGVVGLETAFAAVYTTMVESGLMPYEHLIKVMAANPRRILNLPEADHIKPGMKADLVVVNTKEEQIIDPSRFKSKGRATPYEGLTLKGKVIMTIHNGKIVFENEQ